MLGVTELDRIFEAATAAGFQDVELYLENSHTASVLFTSRTDGIRYHHRQGISIHAVKDGVPHHFALDGIDPMAAAAVFGATLDPAPQTTPVDKPATDFHDAVSTLLQIARSAFSSSNETLQSQTVGATLCRKKYVVARLGEEPATGEEESAELRADWKAQSTTHRWERARGSIAGLIADVQAADGVAAAVKLSLTATPQWPAPEGKLPILWSARCVAKLQMLLLRAFEGDLVLGNRSFLTALELPLPFRFTLEDRPKSAGEQFDHEGSRRRAMTLLREGRPTALACNKDVARQLEVPPTGHARRQSFDAPAVVGFWHPHLEAGEVTEALLATMDRGISVREMDVVTFDPATGRVVLRLNQSFLVHHGLEGEAMEPLTLQTDLVELLSSFEGFESRALTTGLAVGKRSQRLITEVTAPAALSRPYPLPGTVPLNHYW